MPLCAKSDLILLRERLAKPLHHKISSSERRYVLNTVKESSYILYDYYRTAFIKESRDIDDVHVANEFNWPIRKVADCRRELTKANLIYTDKIGTGKDTITKFVVGLDRVALCKAGLPDNITDVKAFMGLKAEFNIHSPEDLIERLPEIISTYESVPLVTFKR